MARTYKSAQGKTVDIETLRLQNELVPAIGNMRVNARGDQLGAGGKVVKSREQMLDDHYNSNLRRNRDDDGLDEIPTSGGKARKVEPTPAPPSVLEVDIFEEEVVAAPPPVVEQPTPKAPVKKRKTVTKKAKPAAPEPVVEATPEPVVEATPAPAKSVEFEFTGDTEESITKEKAKPADMSGFSKGGKALKGGLAKALAKTQAYEKAKNPGPTRM